MAISQPGAVILPNSLEMVNPAIGGRFNCDQHVWVENFRGKCRAVGIDALPEPTVQHVLLTYYAVDQSVQHSTVVAVQIQCITEPCSCLTAVQIISVVSSTSNPARITEEAIILFINQAWKMSLSSATSDWAPLGRRGQVPIRSAGRPLSSNSSSGYRNSRLPNLFYGILSWVDVRSRQIGPVNVTKRLKIGANKAQTHCFCTS